MTIQKVLLGSIMAIAATLISTPASMARSSQNMQIAKVTTQQQVQELTQEINDSARSRGLTVKNVKVNQSLSAGSNGFGATAMAAGSCTVSATVSIPGGTGVTISATAPTCAGAERMVLAGIRELKNVAL